MRHYFVGTHDIGSYYSAAQYEQDVLALVAELNDTYHSLLLTGGRGEALLPERAPQWALALLPIALYALSWRLSVALYRRREL